MRNTVIDTRDLAKELDALESELADIKERLEECEEEYIDETYDDNELEIQLQSLKDEFEEWLGDNEERLNDLRKLRDEIPEWKYGEALIADSYFEEYAQDLASDLYGNEINDARWPFDCIDWKKAADELKPDYTRIEFDGDTWWYRA